MFDNDCENFTCCGDEMLNKPVENLMLLQIKANATRGSERGPHYDQGVLSVTSQIEETGKFTPHRLAQHVLMFRDSPHSLNQLELHSIQQFLAETGMTADEALSYAVGVEFAEIMLRNFNQRDWVPCRTC
jgi:hypothetical protein